MIDGIGETDGRHQRTIYQALSHHRRRQILKVVVTCNHSITDTELAERVLEESTDDSIQRLLVDLRHVHLPILDDVGLLEWERANNTLTLTEQLSESTLTSLLEAADALGDERLDLVTDSRRRQILSTARERSSPVSVSELVDDLLEAEDDASEATSIPTHRRELRLSLSHTHLPLLDDADFLAFDPADDTVTFHGHDDGSPTQLTAEHSRVLLTAPSLT
ncbi:hypothetical protein ACLI4Y_16180 [Natrialbaceae archaeon A-CW3]